jgi:hypothetical protein
VLEAVAPVEPTKDEARKAFRTAETLDLACVPVQPTKREVRSALRRFELLERQSQTSR